MSRYQVVAKCGKSAGFDHSVRSVGTFIMLLQDMSVLICILGIMRIEK